MNPIHRKFDLKSLLLGTALGVVIMLSVAASTGSPHTTWEYRLVQGQVFGPEHEIDKAINAAVAEGWEFVSASSSTHEYGFAIMRREKK